jgi:hypothetical protein
MMTTLIADDDYIDNYRLTYLNPYQMLMFEASPYIFRPNPSKPQLSLETRESLCHPGAFVAVFRLFGQFSINFSHFPCIRHGVMLKNDDYFENG